MKVRLDVDIRSILEYLNQFVVDVLVADRMGQRIEPGPQQIFRVLQVPAMGENAKAVIVRFHP